MYKVNEIDIERIKKMNVKPEYYKIGSLVLMLNDNFIYYGIRTKPGEIIKADIVHLKSDLFVLDKGEDNVKCLCNDGTYLYAGLGTCPGKIVKIDIPSFKKVDVITFDDGENYVCSLFFDDITMCLYADLDVVPRKRVIIDVPSFKKVSTVII